MILDTRGLGPGGVYYWQCSEPLLDCETSCWVSIMKEVGGRQLVECMICKVLVGSVYSYYMHNIKQHSLAQLSRAILKLRNLKMPMIDPMEENAIDEFDAFIKINELPVKVEVMDEIIELGPTDNSDHLQVKSRLLNSSDEVSHHSSQVIEVKENNPPPCQLNPTIEDVNNFTMRFNKELITAKDSHCPAMPLIDYRKKLKDGNNKVLRASFKTFIEIPNPNTFLMDYKKGMPYNTEKYVMQNMVKMAPTSKKKRGRPRKKPDIIKSDETQVAVKDEAMNSKVDEEDTFTGDSPLFSEEDDEDESVAIPNIAKTRSGRTVKKRKEDGEYKYYDEPGNSQLEEDDLAILSNQEADSMIKSKRGRKRKWCPGTGSYKANHGSQIKEDNVDITGDFIQDNDVSSNANVDRKENNDNERVGDINISCTEDDITDDGDTTINLNESVCFMFNLKEECNKHISEHLTKDTPIDGEDTNVNEYEENNDTDMNDMINMSVLEEVQDKASGSNVTASDKYPESIICSVCHNVFESKAAFDDHSHDCCYDCKFCGKKYQNRANLQSHIKKYHEETEWMKFKCPTCDKTFGFLVALERHMKEHDPNQKFSCEQCGKVFKRLTNLKNHIPLHTKDEVFKCPYCPKQYYVKYSFEKHVKNHISPPKFQCEVCNKDFNDKKYFELHLERHQNGGSLGRSKDFKCNHCGDIKSLTELEIVGEGDPGHHKTCLICGKGHYKKYLIKNFVSSLSELQDKTEKEREQCRLCGKFVIDLLRHVKTTHLETSFIPCDVCGTVVSKASLPAHKNRRHGGSAVTCDHCNKVFKNIMSLREHLTKLGKKEDPSRNICKFCKESVPPDLWKAHIKRHKMTCSECGASGFKNHDELMLHLEACRRCTNCGTGKFDSHEDYLAHVEVCGSSIDIMTGTLDAASDQEVVTSIFAIVDDNTCCGTCGQNFEDHLSLANHIAEMHPDVLPIDHTAGEADCEDSLYACPQDTCEFIFTRKELLSDHLTTIHNL